MKDRRTVNTFTLQRTARFFIQRKHMDVASKKTVLGP